MSILTIIEFSTTPVVGVAGSVVACGDMANAVVRTPVQITPVSLQSEVFSARTRFIRVHCSGTCNIAIGSNPTATAGASGRLPMNHTEYFGVIPGDKIAVIEDS